jgi:hypothetical protein
VKVLLLQVLFLSGVLLAVTPFPAEARGLIPCGGSYGTDDEKAPCTICHIVVGGNNLIKWGTGIMAVIAITVLFAMAVLYVVSAGDQGMMQTAKSGIWAALIGFAVMLSAWLIVNTVLSILADTTTADKPLAGLVQNGKFSFTCDTKSKAAQ